MAKPKDNSPLISPEKAIVALKSQLEKALPYLEAGHVSKDEFQKWRSVTVSTLERIWGNESRHFQNVAGKSVGPTVWSKAIPLDWEGAQFPLWIQFTATELEAQIEFLESLEPEPPAQATPAAQSGETPISNRVFVVHGHDDAVRETVAACLRKLDLDPIILHEQANEGRTLIEKIEKHADVGFAVVILTPDDQGGIKDKPLQEQSPRARQNVVLEFGYFMALLGRSRVCPLYSEGVERPSDIDGLVYVPLDAGGSWKFRLVRELRAANYDVSADALL